MKKVLSLCAALLLTLDAVHASARSIDDVPQWAVCPALWGDIDYHGAPWVTNVSSLVEASEGLQGRHLSVWASHGRYFDNNRGQWEWQRPLLFSTTEDLFTQTIVVPYLIPML